MARLSSLQKAQRVLRFVLSLRNPKISGVLAAHGFGPDDLDEVWTLFQALAPVSFVPARTRPNPTGDALRAIIAWRKRWQLVINACLTRHHPALADAWKARQRETLVAHPIPWAMAFASFHGWLSTRAASRMSGRAALALLATRGLTPALVDELRGLTDQAVGLPGSARAGDATAPTADIEEAIGRLWAWYLEWGEVVRTQVEDGRLLRQAGFLSGERRSKPKRRRAVARSSDAG